MNKIIKITVLVTTLTLFSCSKQEYIKEESSPRQVTIVAEEPNQVNEEAQRLAAQKAQNAKQEAQRLAAEKAQKAQQEAQRLVTEKTQKAQQEAQRLATEKTQKANQEAQRLATEKTQKANQEAQRLATEEAQQAQQEAQRLATEEAQKVKQKVQRLAAEKANLPKAQNITKKHLSAGEKTPVGAQRSGNSAGTIPAWTGGITKPPSIYKKGDHHQDPFANDKILFTIDASNYNQYASELSVGQKAMFEKYPQTYKMNIYQTRRSASFPKRIYQKTIENGKTGKLSADGEGVESVAEGFPFPNFTNAFELILNHKLKYKGSGGVRYNNQVAPTASGRFTVVKLREELLGKYYIPGNTVEDINNVLLYFYQEVESPARLAGRILLVHETMNQKVTPRQAWIYNPGQRRVRRAPNVAYDNPGTASDGLRTNDMTDMFNGAMDRFNWEFVGTKEMYVPYNSYKVHSGDLDYADIVRPGHLNSDLMRYELHRVHVIEAKLKEGIRHINSRRTFYLDEDSYQILLTDHYDKRKNIWRFSEAHSINYYDVPTFWSTVETHHDLRSGRYVAVGLDNKDPVNTFDVPLSEANYTPQALRKRGRR
ncbi:MAG: DUF1329 domain-containing protein [Proteobacteria bacterium]|nr:DUF1329 domain-containing protein [Pseudomonadota bacterium]